MEATEQVTSPQPELLQTAIGPIGEVPAERKKVKVRPMKKTTTKKKAVKKSSKPKAAKKSAGKKKGAKKAGNRAPRKKKEGLLKSQITIMKALAKLNKSVTLEGLSKKCGLTTGCIPYYIGPEDEKIRKNHEEKFLKYPSLLTLKLVRIVRHPKKMKDGTFSDDKLGVREFEATAAGRKEAAKY